ncbi:MAG: hypothetical protein LBB04_03535 [Oscillospiraceae bacterium]|jgi:hypothetical protein|nr:hypothetical protein [Oscillospiraceae bacterium]
MLMQFGEFVFKENPIKINIKYARNLNLISIPGVGEIVQNKGRLARIVNGEGLLCGQSALKDFEKLTALFEASDDAKLLVLPSGEIFPGYFSKLLFMGEGSAERVRYSFEFVENCLQEGSAK